MRTVAAQVLYRDCVIPRNIVFRSAQSGRQLLPLRRAGDIIAANHGPNRFRIQSAGCDELAETNSGLFHVAR